MRPLAFHLVFRLRDDRVFATSAPARRRLARVMSSLAEVFPVLAWRCVDTHLHVLGLLTEAEIGELTRRLRIVLARLHPDVPLLLARQIPVQNQWHLAEAFGYVLRQDEHHGVGNDPYQEASCVPDLLGLRFLSPALVGRVREHLPRVRRAHVLPRLGVSRLEEGVGAAQLVDAACAAFALADLAGNSAEVTAARVAAVHASRELGTAEVAAALGLTRRAVNRLAAKPMEIRGVRAIRLRVGLRLARPLVPDLVP